MKDTLDFILEIGKLKRKPRRGWVIHKIKNPETTAEHTFHLALFVWALGGMGKLNLNRAIKMALVHDLCEIYSPDFTSYDAAAIKEGKRITTKELLAIRPKMGRPTAAQRRKMEKIKQRLELRAIRKLTLRLPASFRKEIMHLWLDYENGFTAEGRFVKQADRIINLLQGLEYWKKYGKIEHRLWVRRAKEVICDPILLEFIKKLEIKFCKGCKR